MIYPHFGRLDEIDLGLDIELRWIVAKGVYLSCGPEFGSMMFTHYVRCFDYIISDVGYVMKGGRMFESGGPELAKELEKTGYEHLKVGDVNG